MTVPDLTGTGLAVLALTVFLAAYVLVIAEEFLHLRKSKPVVVAAGVIWILVGIAALRTDGMDAAALLIASIAGVCDTPGRSPA